MSRLNLAVENLAGQIDRSETIDPATNPIVILGLFRHLTKRGATDDEALTKIWLYWRKHETIEAFEAEMHRLMDFVETLVVKEAA